MRIPDSGRKRALFIVDVQPSFVKPKHGAVIGNIARLMTGFKYDLYIESTFFVAKDSIWGKQVKYSIGKKERTIPAIRRLLPEGTVSLVKSTKSVFRNDAKLMRMLKRKGIREVHVVGFVTDDCVLATAFDAFDAGFFTYVIEECTGSGTKRLHDAAIAILRKEAMTNRSVRERIASKRA